MKKLLAMVMAMTMLCASMGVLATDETEDISVVESNVVFNVDFDPNKEGEEVVASKEGVTTFEGAIVDKATVGIAVADGQPGPTGDKCAQIANGKRILFDWRAAANSKLEYGNSYKLGFWFYSDMDMTTTTQTSPNAWVLPKLEGVGINASGQYYTTPIRASMKPTWNYYEIYFTTAESGEEGTKPSMYLVFKGNGGTDNTSLNYYDDITITKADGAFISFAKTTDYGTSQFNSNFFSKNTPRKDITLAGGTAGIKTWVYPRVVRSLPVTSFTGATRVMAQYSPKTLNEKTTLIAVVYEKQGDKSVVKNIYMQNHEYVADEVMSTEDETVLDHYLLQPTTTYLDIPEADYAANRYIKAFMWSSVAGLIPVSGTATLPAAPVVETPAA